MCAQESTWDSSKKTTAYVRLHTLDCRIPRGTRIRILRGILQKPATELLSILQNITCRIPTPNLAMLILLIQITLISIYERMSKRDTEVAQGLFSSDTIPGKVQLSSTWILASQISRFFGSTTLLFQFHTRFRHIFSYRLQFASLAASCIALSSN